MKTSIPEIIRTERFLKGELPPDERVVFEARMLVDAELKNNTFFHSTVHRLITLYQRKKIKVEVELLHARIFHDPERAAFKESIFKLFNS